MEGRPGKRRGNRLACVLDCAWYHRWDREYPEAASRHHDAARAAASCDQAIREAYMAGLPMAAIAEVLGMSHQRVSQIVRS